MNNDAQKRGGRRAASDFASESRAELPILTLPGNARADGLDPQWVALLIRLGVTIAMLAGIAEVVLANWRWGDVRVNSLFLPVVELKLVGLMVIGLLSFRISFGTHWKAAILGSLVFVIGMGALSYALLGDQVTPFVIALVVVTASCVLLPWDFKWQAGLTAGLLAAMVADTLLVRPCSPYIGALWLGFFVSAALALAGNRLWAGWRTALAESEARQRKMLEAQMDSITLIRLRDGRYLYVNEAFLKRGYKREDVLGKSIAELHVREDADLAESLARLKGERHISSHEVNLRFPDGRLVPHLLSLVLLDLDGEECVLSVARDITEIKQARDDLIAAQERLRRSEGAARAASRAKSEFLSSMSHEIRTPMNAILGMADLLAETRLTAEQRRFVRTMVSNGNALLNLINGVLDLAKIESGRLSLEETDFDLEELIEHVAETLSMRAAEKGLELTARILPDVPRRLVGDTLRLRQVLINLVGNAIKFTERGEVAITIERAADQNDQAMLRFSVRDTGIGIEPEKLEAIFQSFTQADSSTTRRYGGSGLGLTIASRLVELMGGRIRVTSELGAGSNFQFIARLRAADGPSPSADKLPYLEKVPVLVVDDNATNRLILRELLSAQGAEVCEASSGREALALAERAAAEGRPYRIVLLDCRMPEMDGLQVARQLKRRAGGPPPIILMLSSEDLNQTLVTAREIGIDLYIIKPIRRAELLRAIASAMGRAPAESQTRRAASGATAAGARPLSILLVEDSPDNRQLIHAYLKTMPYQLDSAENGQVAVAKFIKGRYDIVLMDIQMPVMDGHAAVRKIREWEREQGRAPTPIIALTASALEEDVRKSVEVGCTAHVSKPVKKAVLLAAIGELTEPAGPRAKRSKSAESTSFARRE